MEELKRYAAFVSETFTQNVMGTIIQYGSSWPVKLYFCLLHLLLVSLVLYIFLYSRKKNQDGKVKRTRTRTFKRGNRAVTSETCEWLNSTLAWCYLHSTAKTTPDLIKMWIRNMNRALYKNRTNNQRIFITNICPDCLPPKLASVYCLCVDGTMQCITFHVESIDLGFHVHINQPSRNGTSKNVILEVNVLKLSGEVALQLNNSPLEAKIMFIGEPEIKLSTRAITKDGIDSEAVAAVEEKLKEVICKTVTNVPLAESNAETDAETSNSGLKDKLDSPILQTCVGEEGKLLVKVIKATGLCSKDKSANISPYCIISIDNPFQRKRTSLMKDTDNPFWNDYFPFDITSKTRDITLNIFDFEKTASDVNYHMDDNEICAEQDDFLGQVIVPLAAVNRNQTCRLILPILPKTNNCDYVKGELSLEFTFDKDGKVIDGSLPLVDVTDSKSKATAVEETIYDVTEDKMEAAKPVNESPSGSFSKGFSGAYAYSLDKSYMETSLDELAQEIEAYEAQPHVASTSTSEEKSVEILMDMKTVEQERESAQRKRESLELREELAVLEATLSEEFVKRGEDVEDSKPEEAREKEPEPTEEPIPTPKATPEPSSETTPPPTPELETESKEEKAEAKEEKAEAKPKTKKSVLAAKFKRRPKSNVEGDKKTDKEADTSRHSYHAGDQPEKDQETTQEAAVVKESETTAEGEEEAPSEISREPKSKMRRSYKMKFRRSKKEDKEKVDGEPSSTQEEEAPKTDIPDENKELEAVEESLKSDPPKSRFSKFRHSKDNKEEPQTDETKEEEKEGETADEQPEKPKSRFGRLKRPKENKEEPPTDETKEEGETADEQPEKPKSRFGRLKRPKENKEEPPTDEIKEEGKEGETADEKPEKSKLRFARLKRPKENKEETKSEEKEAKEEKKELETIDENAEKKELETVDKNAEQKEVETVDENAEKKEIETVDENAEQKEVETVDENAEKKEVATVDENAEKKEVETVDENAEKKEVETVDENAAKEEVETVDEKPEKSKSRFARLKRSKENKEEPKAESGDENAEEKEIETADEKPEKSKSRFARLKRSKENKEEPKAEDKEPKEEKKESETIEESAQEKEPEAVDEKVEKKELETVDESAESGPSEKPADQPKARRRMPKLKRDKKRPVSMSAADIKPTQEEDESILDRKDPVRHSYHAGDLPEPPPLQRRSSNTSLLSYSPSPFSSLVIQVSERGERKYYRIPPSMVKRGTYEQKGVKFHVYNDHMFRAVHFDSSTNCAVCGNSIHGLGKQGYQCKDCKLATHKKCHFQTSDMCANSSIKHLNILELPGDER